MKGTRYSILAALLLTLSMLLAACGGGSSAAPTSAPAADATAPAAAGQPTAAPAASGDQIELRIAWWGGQTRHDKTLQVISMFEQEHPNIKIIAEYGSWDDHWTKLATQAAGGNLPDIVQQDYSRIGEWAQQGLMLPLDPYVSDGTIDLSKVSDSQISGGKIDGKLYALNLGTNALALLYSPALFEQAGVEAPSAAYTWQDLLDKAGQIQSADNVYGLESFYNAEFFKLWLKDHGKWLYNDAGTALGYDDDQLAAEYFQMLKDAQEAGATPTREFDAGRGTVGPEDYLVTSGDAASILLWSNMPAAIAAAAPDREFNLALPPQAADGGQGVYLKPSMFFSIAATSQHPKEAAMFIDYFTNSLEANKVLAAERGVPISSEIRDALKDELPEMTQKVFTYISEAEAVAAPINPPDPAVHGKILADVYNPIIDQLLYGEISPEQAAQQFREQAAPILTGE